MQTYTLFKVLLRLIEIHNSFAQTRFIQILAQGLEKLYALFIEQNSPDSLYYKGHRSSTTRKLKIMNGQIIIVMLITGLVVPGPPQKLQLIGHGLGQHRIDAPEGHPGFNKLFVSTGMLKTIRFQINQVLRGSGPVPAL